MRNGRERKMKESEKRLNRKYWTWWLAREVSGGVEEITKRSTE